MRPPSRIASLVKRPQRRPYLEVERLDERTVPATISFVNGTVTVGGTITGAITIADQGSGEFEVEQGAANEGIFQVTNGVTVNLGNHAEPVTLTMKSGTLVGNFIVNAGNQATAVTVGGTAGDTGTIVGGVTVNGGYGTKFNLMTTVGTVNVLGSVTAYGDFGDNNSVTVGDGTAFSIGGNLNVHAFAVVTVNSGTTVRNNVVIDMQETATSFATAYSTTSVTFNTGSKVLGTLTGTDPHDSSTFSLNGTVGGITLNLGDGSNSATVNGNINGNLTINAVNTSSNTIAFSSTAPANDLNVIGNVTLNLLGDAETYSFNNPFSVVASSSIKKSNDFNSNTFTFDGTVTGPVQFTLGSGDNSVTFAVSERGGLIYQGGTGSDTVTLNAGDLIPTVTWNGASTDQTLTLVDNATVIQLSINGGSGSEDLTLSDTSPNTINAIFDKPGSAGSNSISIGSLAPALTTLTIGTFYYTGSAQNQNLTVGVIGNSTTTINTFNVNGSTGTQTLTILAPPDPFTQTWSVGNLIGNIGSGNQNITTGVTPTLVTLNSSTVLNQSGSFSYTDTWFTAGSIVVNTTTPGQTQNLFIFCPNSSANSLTLNGSATTPDAIFTGSAPDLGGGMVTINGNANTTGFNDSSW